MWTWNGKTLKLMDYIVQVVMGRRIRSERDINLEWTTQINLGHKRNKKEAYVLHQIMKQYTYINSVHKALAFLVLIAVVKINQRQRCPFNPCVAEPGYIRFQ